MNFFRIHTLQKRLLLLLLLPIVLLLMSSGFIGFFFARNNMLSQWDEAATLKLQRAAHDIDMRLSEPFQILKIFNDAGRSNIGGVSQDLIVEHIGKLEGVTRVRIDMMDPPRKPHHMAEANGTHGMMKFHRSVISNITTPRYDAEAGLETVSLISSLLDRSDTLIGYLEVVIRFDYLMAEVFNLGWWQSDMACLVDQNGKYLVHTKAMMKDRRQLGETGDPLELSVLDKMQTNPFGTVKGHGHPPEMVVGYHSLRQAPWIIMLFAPGDKILTPIIRFRNYYFLGSFILVLTILLLIRSSVGKIVFPIQTLSRAAKGVANGDYDVPVSKTSDDEIGQLIDSYNAMVEGLKERDYIRDTFGRYIDKEFAKKLLHHPEVASLGGRKREVVIMMSDIRGFTPLSENLEPEQIIRILNHYFSHMIRVIKKHQGILVDFVGDGVLVFFDPLDGPVNLAASEAVQCAFNMHAEMKPFNAKITLEGLPKIEMGIGINAGEVVVGNIGSELRAKYGIVGSPVNVTQRIQSKASAGETMISGSVLHYVRDTVEINHRIDAQLKGIQKPVRLYAVGPVSMRPTGRDVEFKNHMV
jgi:adenylate cyclase